MTKEENKTVDKENTKSEAETGEVAEEQETRQDNPTAEVKEEKSAEEVLQGKLDEINDKYIRLYSEFDNYRKRTQKEKVELHKTAGEDIFKTLLPVLDDFERALNSMQEAKEVSAVKEGVELIFSKLKNNLQQKGLTAMESKGETFDADIHEAVTNIPAPDESLKGKVVEELEKGYSLNGKVIRFAKVVVGN